MNISIVDNAKRNIVTGFINKAVIMLCPFITKMVIQHILGAHYLGLDSLFTSILSVLSLSELGFSTAIVASMYKPVAEGDNTTINALLNFYRFIYRIIGFVILVLGLVLIPFLPYFIKGDYPKDINLTFLYCLYLFNSVLSYFLYAYLNSLIIVYQRSDISSIRNSITRLLLFLLRIAVLYIFKNYYYYVLLMPLFTIIENIWIAVVVKKLFPQYKCDGKPSKELIHSLKKQVVGTFINKACGISRNSFDSICISAFAGLTITAQYSNYFYISNSITGLLMIFYTSIIGGVGNHVATKKPKDNFDELQKLDFIYLSISGWCAAFLLCLYQPFMCLWMGKSMLLSNTTVFLFVLYFYVLKLGDIRYMYTETNGLFWEQRWKSICETISNLILNIILGKLFGVNGVIIATLISLIFINYIWGTRITFKYYFHFSPRAFYSYQFRMTFVNALVCFVTFGICNLLDFSNVFSQFIIRMFICILVPGIIYYFSYRKSPLFSYFLNRLTKR